MHQNSHPLPRYQQTTTTTTTTSGLIKSQSAPDPILRHHRHHQHHSLRPILGDCDYDVSSATRYSETMHVLHPHTPSTTAIATSNSRHGDPYYRIYPLHDITTSSHPMLSHSKMSPVLPSPARSPTPPYSSFNSVNTTNCPRTSTIIGSPGSTRTTRHYHSVSPSSRRSPSHSSPQHQHLRPIAPASYPTALPSSQVSSSPYAKHASTHSQQQQQQQQQSSSSFQYVESVSRNHFAVEDTICRDHDRLDGPVQKSTYCYQLPRYESSSSLSPSQSYRQPQPHLHPKEHSSYASSSSLPLGDHRVMTSTKQSITPRSIRKSMIRIAPAPFNATSNTAIYHGNEDSHMPQYHHYQPQHRMPSRVYKSAKNASFVGYRIPPTAASIASTIQRRERERMARQAAGIERMRKLLAERSTATR
ncbi:hypothetical protein BDF22DRAFT_669326 [Syncephalis plumigaleata]|nr:hypothetical protein BDF22DRAFT_669326 [Syncephalis plumigaleata]